MATETRAEGVVTPGITPSAVLTRREQFQPRTLLANAGFIAVLIFFTVLFIYPFIWLVSASLKPGAEVFSRELIPDPIQWNNYSRLFELSVRTKGWVVDE